MTNFFKWIFLISLSIWGVTWYLMNELPPPNTARPEMLKEPLQRDLPAKSFTIDYQGQKNIVQPVATYELWGMVVSHNDPFVWTSFDLTHDKKSLDTRDLCVIWGDNITMGDYQNISFRNEDYYCSYSWRTGQRSFNGTQFSNNHLIANDEAVRARIAQVRIGDQIHIKGKLVNYSEPRWNGSFRNTSTSRTDTEMGACEVIFVEEMEILDSPNREIALAHRISFWVMLAALVLFLFV